MQNNDHGKDGTMFKNWCVYLFIPIISRLLCSGCAHDPANHSSTISTKELCGTVKESANVHEFLVNLKLLLDNETLLRQDFYDDECVICSRFGNTKY